MIYHDPGYLSKHLASELIWRIMAIWPWFSLGCFAIFIDPGEDRASNAVLHGHVERKRAEDRRGLSAQAVPGGSTFGVWGLQHANHFLGIGITIYIYVYNYIHTHAVCQYVYWWIVYADMYSIYIIMGWYNQQRKYEDQTWCGCNPTYFQWSLIRQLLGRNIGMVFPKLGYLKTITMGFPIPSNMINALKVDLEALQGSKNPPSGLITI